MREGELDIVAREGDTLVFVEVKSSATSLKAVLSATLRKRRHLVAAAEAYLSKHGSSSTNCRFDLLCIDRDDTISLHRNAFTTDDT